MEPDTELHCVKTRLNGAREVEKDPKSCFPAQETPTFLLVCLKLYMDQYLHCILGLVCGCFVQLFSLNGFISSNDRNKECDQHVGKVHVTVPVEACAI